MANEFFTILTAVGRNKLAAAVAAGTQLALTQMAVGDGDNGAYYNPIEGQTALKHEVWRGAINHLYVDPNNANWIVAELVIPDDVGGWYIREVGLFDSAGAMFAVGKYPESYKPILASGSNKQLYVRMIMEVANTAAVTLQVDPSVVLATRQYVDSKVAGEINKLDGKQSVRVATTATIALTNLQTIDGVALAAGDRVLVKNQAAAADNGIYVVAAGAWTRATDADASIEVTPGLFVPVEQGTINADSIWQLVTDAPITLGTTALAFEMVDGKTGVTAGTYRSVTVNARGQVTGGTNPTTLAGYGITDAVTADQGRAAGIGTDLADTNKAVGDLNAVVTPGEYFYTTANANGPSQFGLLKVWRESQFIIYQLAQTSDSEVFARYRASNGVWQPWRQQGGQPGLIGHFPTPAAPPGWLKANGAVVSRSTYAGLYAIIGTTFGAGDGASTFNLPDLRGEFLRGWDDGRGVDLGRPLAGFQPGTRQVAFTQGAGGDGAVGSWWSDYIASASIGFEQLLVEDGTAARNGGRLAESTTSTTHTMVVSGMSRPRNVAFLACIKY
ncbi:phage tail protein [Ralstonia syzygii]|uniref:phage tail-collar fiber domain-containing protein n=1 Tax=Ralstonia syzygii TaxID=28097 RepID=UPI0035144976